LRGVYVKRLIRGQATELIGRRGGGRRKGIGEGQANEKKGGKEGREEYHRHLGWNSNQVGKERSEVKVRFCG